MNGDHLKTSKVQGDSYPNSTARTPRHPNTFQPSTSPNSPSTPHQLHGHLRHSPCGLGYWSMHVGMPCLRGGSECQGLLSIRLYLPNRSHIGQDELMSSSQS